MKTAKENGSADSFGDKQETMTKKALKKKTERVVQKKTILS